MNHDLGELWGAAAKTPTRATWRNLGAFALVVLVAGCALEASEPSRIPTSAAVSRVTMSAAPRPAPGTLLFVRLNDPISSETARRGDSWRGVTIRDVAASDGTIVPRGSAVNGIVSEARSARGMRGALGLRVITISNGGRLAAVRASEDLAASREGARLALGAYGHRDGESMTASPFYPKATGHVSNVVVAASLREPVLLREGASMAFRVD